MSLELRVTDLEELVSALQSRVTQLESLLSPRARSASFELVSQPSAAGPYPYRDSTPDRRPGQQLPQTPVSVALLGF